jgi:hypothetical protein
MPNKYLVGGYLKPSLLNDKGELDDSYVNSRIDEIIRIVKEQYNNGESLWDRIKEKVERDGKLTTFEEIDGVDQVGYEEMRPINTFFTDKVVNNMVTTEQKRHLIVNFTIKMYKGVLEKYCELVGINKDHIVFIYKGGNVLRFLFTESTKEIPRSISSQIYDEFSQYFKISDNDYEVKISDDIFKHKPESEQNAFYDKIYRNLTALCYIIICVIRRNMAAPDNLYQLTDYYGLQYDAKKQIIEKDKDVLQKQVKEILKADLVAISHGNGICKENQQVGGVVCEPLSDYFILDESTEKEEIIKKVHDIFVFNDGNEEKPNVDANKVYKLDQIGMPGETPYVKNVFPLRASVNTGILIEKTDAIGNKFNIRFNLVRTKFIFVMKVKHPNNQTQSIQTSGEHIDCSLQYRAGFDRSSVVEYKDEKGGYTFFSYNYDYYIKDLYRMLFDETKYPWNDIKYAKRLYRLVYLYCYSLLFYDTNDDPNIKNIGHVVNVLDEVKDIIKKLKEEPLDVANTYIDQVKSLFTSDKIKFGELFEAMRERALNVAKEYDENISQYKGFWDNLIGVIEKINNMNRQYQSHIKSGSPTNKQTLYGQKVQDIDKSHQHNSNLMTKLHKLESTNPDRYNEIMKNLGLEL